MIRISTLGGCVLLAGVGIAAAQHTGHQAPDQPAAALDQQVVAACVQSQQQATMIAARLNRRLESARQTNSAADMRAALDDLQAGLNDMEAALRACDPLQASAAAPSPVPTEAVDPVCGMKVDPRSGPNAAYQGKTYYFCSESDRQRFLKDPAIYIKKRVQ